MNKYEVLMANRSESNESNAKEMYGCIADDAGRVVCYFPSKASLDKYSEVIKFKLQDLK